MAATQPSYLVVNENFNRGWTARIGHRTLRPLRLDGWEQAWALPAGTAGVVTLTFLPDPTYRLNLLAGFAAIAVVFAIALVPFRRRRSRRRAAEAKEAPPAPIEQVAPGTTAASPRPRRAAMGLASILLLVGAVVVSVAGLWLGGYAGALVLPVATAAFVAALALRSRSPVWRLLGSAWVVTGLLAVAAAIGAIGTQLRHAGHAGSVVTALWNTCPQVLCLIVLARLLATLIAQAPKGES